MVTRRAHAKVNLMLSVGEARPEGDDKAGYHPIASWFVPIDLCDEIRVEKTRGPSTYDIRWADDAPRASLIDWPLDQDLAVRAHRALEDLVGKPLPIAMQVHKRIPVGGGLGGGSSDAAACLLGIRELYELALEVDEIRTIARTLGSDVEFFLDDAGEDGVTAFLSPPRAAIVTGLGDEIERIDIESLAGTPLLLVVPAFGCATRDVYRAFDDALAAELKDYRLDRAVMGQTGKERSTAANGEMVRSRVQKMVQRGALDPDLLFNDLARPAFGVDARLGQLVTALSNATRSQAHVTGSGSCVLVAASDARLEWYESRVRRACEALAATGAFGGEIGVRVVRLAGNQERG